MMADMSSRAWQVDGGAEGSAALRAQLAELRNERSRQLAELSEVPAGEDELAAPREVSLRSALTEIDAALARLEDGSYGECERCRRLIPAERLEIMPYARYCVACQTVR